MSDPHNETDEHGAAFCLTELSNASLVGGALAVSAVLWLAIMAVL